LLDRDQVARIRPVPGQELADHPLGPFPLLGAVPGTAEVEVMPDLVDPLRDVGVIGALSGQDRGGVDHRA
jgi:hypothetical protein